MKEQTKLAGKAFAVLLTSAVLGFGQVNIMPSDTAPPEGPNNANYPIQTPMPAGSGSINYVEGQASIDGATLSLHSVGSAVLEPNQVLNTGDGYAEVLLTPGAFLRMGHGSEVRMLSAGLADTRVQLVRGTAIVEVDQMIKGTHLALAINGPGKSRRKVCTILTPTTKLLKCSMEKRSSPAPLVAENSVRAIRYYWRAIAR
jgi:hypothetical protein